MFQESRKSQKNLQKERNGCSLQKHLQLLPQVCKQTKVKGKDTILEVNLYVDTSFTSQLTCYKFFKVILIHILLLLCTYSFVSLNKKTCYKLIFR
jgi:hypothetical protein